MQMTLNGCLTVAILMWPVAGHAASKVRATFLGGSYTFPEES